MRFSFLALALVFLPASPSILHAAIVSPKGGEVRVGDGHGFQRIDVPTEVAAGAQVMVGSDGAASIAYADHCVVSAPAAAITIVERRAPCAGFPEPYHFGFAQSTEVGIGNPYDASVGFTPKVDAPESSQAPDPIIRRRQDPGEPRTGTAGQSNRPGNDFLIVGGIVLGAGALAAVLLTQSGDSPASP